MPEDVRKLRRVVSADVTFMRRHGIMDYSLLLSAEKIGEDFTNKNKNKNQSHDKAEVRVSLLNYPEMDDEDGDGEFQELPDPTLQEFNPSL